MSHEDNSHSSERQGTFLQSLSNYSHEYRAAHWSRYFSKFLETVLQKDTLGVTCSSYEYM